MAPGDHPAERQRRLALLPVGRAVTFVVLWHSGSGPASASAWLGRVQMLRWEAPQVWEAARPPLTQEMTVAEPLGRAMAPAEDVTSAALHPRQEVPTALQTTQKAAAVRATLEAAAEPTAVGPESHLQHEARTASLFRGRDQSRACRSLPPLPSTSPRRRRESAARQTTLGVAAVKDRPGPFLAGLQVTPEDAPPVPDAQ